MAGVSTFKPTESSDSTSTPVAKERVSPGVIVGAVLGVLAILGFLGIGWRFWKMRTSRSFKDTEISRLDDDDNDYDAGVIPYPLPGTIEVRERRSRLWMKRGSLSVVDNSDPVHKTFLVARLRNTPNRGNDVPRAQRSPGMIPRQPPHPRTGSRPPTIIRSNGYSEVQDPGEATSVIGRRLTTPATMNGNAIIGVLRSTDAETEAIFRHKDSGWRLAFGSTTPQSSDAGSRLEMPPTYSEAG
ncbi:hypothetical protein PQX77_021587 [Marasmius sp. AFHP31]|nr:hypothetical protein PQX77_021587 [Marasmius sp. AFHP31]